MNTSTLSRKTIIITLISIAFLSRFLALNPAWANFSPLGAIALFAGATIADKKWALLTPLLGLWLSNLVLNNIFYASFYSAFSWGFEPIVFISFVGMIMFGMFTLKNNTITRLPLGILGGTLVFFILSNVGVWAEGILYPRTIAGLSACFINALPFLKSSLLSNLVFSPVLFTMFAYLNKRLQWA